jgi:hypothetical protein
MTEDIFRKAIELYCGKETLHSIIEYNEQVLKLGGQKIELFMTYWFIDFHNNYSNEDIVKRLIKTFDIVFEYSENEGLGQIIDFEFNKVLLCYSESEKCLSSTQKIIKELQNIFSDLKTTCALHYGTVIYGNWGASKRFKKMIFGNEYQFCKKMLDVGITENKLLILSNDAKDHLNKELNIKKMSEYGIVGIKDQTTLYEVIL